MIKGWGSWLLKSSPGLCFRNLQDESKKLSKPSVLKVVKCIKVPLKI